MMSNLISDCFSNDIWSEILVSSITVQDITLFQYWYLGVRYKWALYQSDITLHIIFSVLKRKIGIKLWYFSYRTACMQHISNAYTTFNAPVSGVVRGVRLKVQAITRIHQAPTSWHILLYTPDIIHIKLGTWICNAKVIQHIIMQVSIRYTCK